MENIDWWVKRTYINGYTKRFRVYSEPQERVSDHAKIAWFLCDFSFRDGSNPVEFIRSLYDTKLGEIGSYWNPQHPIGFRYAEIVLGDVFDYYTTTDGILRTPKWSSLRFAIDEVMTNHPRYNLHTPRVGQYVEEHDIGNLEQM